MNILITGAKGQLGRSILGQLASLKQRNRVNVYALGRHSLDITNHNDVYAAFKVLKPSVVINAAAYTNVDQAELDPAYAYKVNQSGAANVAAAAAVHNARLVHVSTDYVFGNGKQAPIQENAMPIPLNIYGASKLAGEGAVIAQCPHSIIVRTSAVYSAFGNNFVKTILKAGLDKGYVKVVCDQVSSPTWAGGLASALVHIGIKHCVPAGVYHYAGNTALSWYEFAKKILACAGQIDYRFKNIPVISINTQQSGRKAVRPVFSVLDTSKLQLYGIKPDCTEYSLPMVISGLLLSGDF